jgi:hypothetical protein
MEKRQMGDINVPACLDWIRIAEAVKTIGRKPWSSEKHQFVRILGPIQIRFSYRSANSFMGRFGGGWNWKLGFQAGGSTVILSLLIAELSISRRKPVSDAL